MIPAQLSLPKLIKTALLVCGLAGLIVTAALGAIALPHASAEDTGPAAGSADLIRVAYDYDGSSGLSTTTIGHVAASSNEAYRWAAAVDKRAGLRLDAGLVAPSEVPVVIRSSGLPNDTVLARGGANTPDRFANGSGVTTDSAGNLSGVSVNSGPTIGEATVGIPHNQVGITTVGDVRSAGGSVVPDPTPRNLSHCLVSGCSAETLSDLFTPTIKNPHK